MTSTLTVVTSVSPEAFPIVTPLSVIPASLLPAFVSTSSLMVPTSYLQQLSIPDTLYVLLLCVVASSDALYGRFNRPLFAHAVVLMLFISMIIHVHAVCAKTNLFVIVASLIDCMNVCG